MAAKTKQPKEDARADGADVLDFDENQARPLDPESGKSKKTKKPKKEKGQRRGIGRVISIFIGLLLVAGIAASLYLDLFGLRSNVVVPLLQRIPIVGNIVKSDETAEETATREELLAQIEELTTENERLADDNVSLEESNRMYSDEIARLQQFEAAQIDFNREKEEFDRMIALNDPSAYANFYESIRPENAEELYGEAVLTVQQSKEFKKYINTVQAIDASEAAKILDEMTRTDMNLVVLILNNLDSETSGEILANMTTRNAVSAMRRMVPETAQ